MRNRLALLAALLLGLVPAVASAQSYSPSGFAQVAAPGVVPAPVSLSTACATPLTPTSCAATSYAIFNVAAIGGADYSYQINAINGGTVGFYSSNDGVNFFPSNVTVAGSAVNALAVATSTSAAGKFGGLAGSSAYVAVVMTTASTAAVTVIPYLSTHNAGLSIHGSIPLSLSAIGVGAIFSVPTSGTLAAPVALGTPPAGSTSFEFLLGPGASAAYTFATSASAAATLFSAGNYTLASNPATAAGDIPAPDYFGGLTVYVATVTASGVAPTAVRARYL